MAKWIVPAVLAIPLLLVATLPARVMLRALNMQSLPVEQVIGTVWRGQAVWPAVGHAPLEIRWRWQLPFRWHWEMQGPATALGGYLHPGRDRLRLSTITGAIPVEHLDITDWVPFTRPQGRVAIDLASVEFAGSEPVVVHGRIVWENARLRGAVDEDLGRIELLFPEDTGITATIRSLDAADIMVRGRLDSDGTTYDLDVWLHARRPDLQSSLARLGEVQPDGQVRIRQQGWLL